MIFLDNIIFPPKETIFELKKINKTPPPHHQKKPQKNHTNKNSINTMWEGRAAPNLRTRHGNYLEAAHIFDVIMIKVKPFIYDKSFLQAPFFIMRLNRGVVLPFHVKKISLRYNIFGFCKGTSLCLILYTIAYTPLFHLSLNDRTLFVRFT